MSGGIFLPSGCLGPHGAPSGHRVNACSKGGHQHYGYPSLSSIWTHLSALSQPLPGPVPSFCAHCSRGTSHLRCHRFPLRNLQWLPVASSKAFIGWLIPTLVAEWPLHKRCQDLDLEQCSSFLNSTPVFPHLPLECVMQISAHWCPQEYSFCVSLVTGGGEYYRGLMSWTLKLGLGPE